MMFSRRNQIQRQLSFDSLASALISARARMLPMDFMIVDLNTGDFEKSATLGCIQSYFGQSLHVSLSGYGDSVLRGLFAQLLTLGMNPNSEEQGFYFGEWKSEPDGRMQVVGLLSLLEQELGIPTKGRVQVSGPEYLYDEIRADGKLLELAAGTFELGFIEPQSN